MSGMVMHRRDDGVVLLSDGGLYAGREDFTLTGFASKPILLPHLPAVMCIAGAAGLPLILQYCHADQWEDFDSMVLRLRGDVVASINTLFRFEPMRTSVHAIVYLGGYSATRGRWETYDLLVASDSDELEDGVGSLTPAQAIVAIPGPSDEALAKHGFADPDVANAPYALVQLMRAMRDTPQAMGGVGDAFDDCDQGSTIGGFIEQVYLCDKGITTSIVWRWPDEVGQMVDPSQQGAPALSWYSPEITTSTAEQGD